jgi:hypothetical protein
MEYDLKTEAGVVDYMKASSSESDWNNRCDKVKRVNSGYPDFWYKAIVMSGIVYQVMAGWQKP